MSRGDEGTLLDSSRVCFSAAKRLLAIGQSPHCVPFVSHSLRIDEAASLGCGASLRRAGPSPSKLGVAVSGVASSAYEPGLTGVSPDAFG